ncbi:MAG TPA: methyltransferase domain-containing protein [Patescibacteria group bacterium]|nr:methyltransferase domain-containing protein [Patescibacteria group bacterium]
MSAPVPEYKSVKYEHLDRWISYYRQIQEVLSLRPEDLLEIGKGSGLVSTVLKSRGLDVTSLDIDPDVKPDVVGSVLALPFADKKFDVTLCAEVLEHLPFEDFPKALSEIRRVTRRAVVLSLPNWGWTFWLGLKLPMLPKLDLFWKLTGILKHPPGGEHFWEIGKRGYPLRRISDAIGKAGFRIRKTYLKPDSPYHRFFLLEIA